MVNRALKIIGFGILLLVLALPSRAQNTKGDKPAPSRESRFKKATGKEKRPKRIKSKRRTTSSLRAYRPRKKSKGGERAGRPLGPVYNSKPRERPRNVYPKSRRYVNNSSQKPGDKARRRANTYNNRVTAKPSTGSTRNVYPQSGRFVNYSSKQHRKPPRKRRVVPRSASGSFIARKSINAWARFPRPKPKREKAYTKDIAGRRLRTKNFETKRPPVIKVPGGTAISQTPKRRNVYSRPRRITTSPARRSRNVYSQSNRYVNNYSRQPKKTRIISNRSALAQLRYFQSGDKRPGRKRKVVPRSASRPFIRAKSINAWAHFPRRKRKGEKAITTDIAGKRLRTKNFETRRPDVIINPTSPYSRKRRGDRPYKGSARGGYVTATRAGKAWRGDITNRRIRKNYSSKPGFEGKPVRTPEKRRVGMRDQGEGYSGNIKFRRSAKGGGSVSGRTWNNQGRAVPVRPPGMGRGAAAYQGNIRFGKRGFENQGEEYSGNIKTKRPLKGGGSVSGRIWNNRGQAVPVRPPGMGRGAATYQGNIRFSRRTFNDQGEEYTGNIKARRPLKGGGSVSGHWNNQGRAVPVRPPGMGRGAAAYQGNIKFSRRTFSDQGEEYSGSIKTRRPLKGGGSVSGHWNNRGRAVPVRPPGMGRGAATYQGNIRFSRRTFNDQGEEYTGNIKARRPLKGGGSVSGHWNNRGQAIAGRTPGMGSRGIGKYQGNIRPGKMFQNQGEEYSGNIKAKRPAKGGGSVSGKRWNNKGTPIAVRAPSTEAARAGKYSGNLRTGRKTFNNQGEEFTGYLKTRRPAKGGGSISGKLWNNKETPVAVRTPTTEAAKAGKYSGNLRAGRKTFNNQGEEFTGNVKTRRSYVKNTNAAEEALKVRRPKTTYEAEGLQVKVRRPMYGRRRNAPEGSIVGMKASKASVKASEYVRGMKQYRYIRNSNSSDDALKVRETGKAFARAADYQGNIKMKKFDLFGRRSLHPDAQFVKINKNNVSGEKNMVTNFKLWWARLFKKNETQPQHLKYQGGKPRYDKGEAGLWYD